MAAMPPHKWRRARLMWRNGKDTLFIAQHFGISEARIYNGLSHGRGSQPLTIRSPSPRFNIVTHKRLS